MTNWYMGFIMGLGIGIAIGFSFGKKQKSWHELADKEKKIRVTFIVLIALGVIAGLVTFFLVR